MLIDSGPEEDDDSNPSPFQDLFTQAEQTVGRLVMENYRADCCILSRWGRLDYATV